MADTSQILALKPYLEAVENRCRNFSYQELCDLICDMAQEADPAERARFLARLELRPQPEEQPRAAVDFDDELLERIRELKEATLERQEAIEDGTYYEEYDDYSDYRGYGGYYDDESEVISDEQREECANLFAENMGGGRIDGIVANQHCKSYDRAAEVLGALMECALLNDQSGKDRSLLETYRNQKYKRHPVFRREVETVLRNSPTLVSTT